MLKKYLRDRGQYVDMNGRETNQKRITKNVRQGSTLGPFHILLYFNKLDSSSGSSQVSMFADDSIVFDAKRS